MVKGGNGHGLILNNLLEIFNTYLIWFIFVVAILGMYSGLMGSSAKTSSIFMNIGEMIMSLGLRYLNRVSVTNKYNQMLKPKRNLS